MISGDWGGSVTLKNCKLDSYTNAEIQAAAPCNPAKIEIYAGEKLLGVCDIEPSENRDVFESYRIPLEKYDGICNMRLELKGMVSVFSVQLS